MMLSAERQALRRLLGRIALSLVTVLMWMYKGVFSGHVAALFPLFIISAHLSTRRRSLIKENNKQMYVWFLFFFSLYHHTADFADTFCSNASPNALHPTSVLPSVMISPVRSPSSSTALTALSSTSAISGRSRS